MPCVLWAREAASRLPDARPCPASPGPHALTETCPPRQPAGPRFTNPHAPPTPVLHSLPTCEAGELPLVVKNKPSPCALGPLLSSLPGNVFTDQPPVPRVSISSSLLALSYWGSYQQGTSGISFWVGLNPCPSLISAPVKASVCVPVCPLPSPPREAAFILRHIGSLLCFSGRGERGLWCRRLSSVLVEDLKGGRELHPWLEAYLSGRVDSCMLDWCRKCQHQGHEVHSPRGEWAGWGDP